MAEKPIQHIAINHNNGQQEVVGFFIIHRGQEENPLMKKGATNPAEAVLRWNTFAQASEYVARKAKSEMQIMPLARSDLGQDVVWLAAPKSGTGPIWRISYIGSFHYFSGRPVDPMLVGTPNEVFDKHMH